MSLDYQLISAVHDVDLQNLMGYLQVASSSILRETLLEAILLFAMDIHILIL